MSSYNYCANNPIKYIDPDGERLALPNKEQANKVAKDLNRIYENKYGATDAFKVVTRTVKLTKSNPEYSWWNPFTWREPETIKVTESRTFIEANEEFNWSTDKYTAQMKYIIDSDSHIWVREIADKGSESKSMSFGSDKGFLSNFGGGYIKSSREVLISDALAETSTINKNKNLGKWTIGGVVLHELLYHIHPDGAKEKSPNDLRIHYNQRTGKTHGAGSNQNLRVGSKND